MVRLTGAPSQTLKGMTWMLASSLLFAGMTGIVRHLGSDMPAPQAAFIRYLCGTLILAPFLFRMRLRELITPRMGLHALRGVAHGIGVMLWFFAMARIPLAEVTALSFTAPLFVTIGAALFLGERLRARRITAVTIGFIGTLIIVRPGLISVDVGALAQIAAAPLFAGSVLISKHLTKTEASGAIIALLSVFVSLTLLPFALATWRTPAMSELAWLFAAASFASIGHYAVTQAFRAADISVTQPISFIQLVWAALMGYFLFDETSDHWVWIGALVIVGSASYIAHREAKLARRGELRTIAAQSRRNRSAS